MKTMSGNMNQLTTDETYIYRNRNPWSNTVNGFITHLNNSGFSYAPLYIKSTDTTDIFTYIEGDTFQPSAIADRFHHQEILEKLADILKEFHQIGSTFLWENKSFFLKYEGALPLETICHNDIAPYNTLVDAENNIVAIIDYDTLCPGPRVWDIVYAAYRFIGLGQEVFTYQKNYTKEQLHQLRFDLTISFTKQYGIAFPEDFFLLLIERLQSLINLFDQEILKGNSVFIKMKDEGHYHFYIDEIAYIKANY